ncbi:MAG: HAMP domain-containing histidine kinase [Gammaproteobacteria bacterium]|nr:HAMP domain-containing histidine kinase [Gammaproteobacteria bacterium]
MRAEGALLSIPRRRLRILVLVGASWLALLLGLVLWWAYVVLQQGERIAELEVTAGLARGEALVGRERVHNMLMWESGAFIVILLSATAVLAWLYYRDSVRNRALHAFFAALTHELRTPLAALRLQAEAIAEDPEAPPARHASGRRLLDDLSRLESQVERTLELARVEGGGRVLEEPIALEPLLRHFCATLPESLAGRVALHVAHTRSDTRVLGDKVAIQLILRNLVENAVRHAQRNKVELIMSLEHRGSGVTLHCMDNGAGFEGNAARLGTLFYRGERSSGAGVGLYLIKALMTQMGGAARFDSARDHGFEAVLHFREAAA